MKANVRKGLSFCISQPAELSRYFSCAEKRFSVLFVSRSPSDGNQLFLHGDVFLRTRYRKRVSVISWFTDIPLFQPFMSVWFGSEWTRIQFFFFYFLEGGIKIAACCWSRTIYIMCTSLHLLYISEELWLPLQFPMPPDNRLQDINRPKKRQYYQMNIFVPRGIVQKGKENG